MKNIRQTFWLFCFAFCFCWLVACSGDRWNGGKYEGEVSINGVKPHDAKPEKFQIVTVKIPDGTMRLVKMDPANKYLANCDLQIDETYMKGVTDDARFPFTERSSVCHASVDTRTFDIPISYGDLTLEGNNAKVSVIGTTPDGAAATIEIKGIRR